MMMNAVRRRAWAPTARSATPLLQRTCACGGMLGPTGTCTACRRSQGLGRHTKPRAIGRPAFALREAAVLAPAASSAVALDADQAPTPQGNTSKTGHTTCDPRGDGIKKGVKTTNKCFKMCTEKHEQKHVEDMGPCCAAAQQAYKAAEDEEAKERVLDQFEEWGNRNRDTMECRAYHVSHTCGMEQRKARKCEDSSYNTCCVDLTKYLQAACTMKRWHCKLGSGDCVPAPSPPAITPCPFPINA